MDEDKTIVIGEFTDLKESEKFDLSSTLRLSSIDQKKLWESKDR